MNQEQKDKVREFWDSDGGDIQAFHFLEDILNESPEDEDALLMMGITNMNPNIYGYVNKSKYATYISTKHFDKVIELNPNNAEAHFWRARMLMNGFDYSGALENISELNKLEPKEATPWYMKGYCLRELGKFEDALTALKKAENLENPKESSTILNLAMVYIKLKEFNNIEAYIDRIDRKIDLDDGLWNVINEDPDYKKLKDLLNDKFRKE